MSNIQKPEHVISFPILEVHSIFKTIQGEGPFTGTPCVFIRLAGCNLQCPNCDTDYTSNRSCLSVVNILNSVIKLATSGLVVITGGEPFRQQIKFLISFLIAEGFYVQVETNGTIEPPEEFTYSLIPYYRKGCYIVCSPKTPIIKDRYNHISCAFKYVMNADSFSNDGLPFSVLGVPLRDKVARPSKAYKGQIYLQPEDSKNEVENMLNVEACVHSCFRNGYILNLQIHKIIGVE
jgi:organic radical activating enzyme